MWRGLVPPMLLPRTLRINFGNHVVGLLQGSGMNLVAAVSERCDELASFSLGDEVVDGILGGGPHDFLPVHVVPAKHWRMGGREPREQTKLLK